MPYILCHILCVHYAYYALLASQQAVTASYVHLFCISKEWYVFGKGMYTAQLYLMPTMRMCIASRSSSCGMPFEINCTWYHDHWNEMKWAHPEFDIDFLPRRLANFAEVR